MSFFSRLLSLFRRVPAPEPEAPAPTPVVEAPRPVEQLELPFETPLPPLRRGLTPLHPNMQAFLDMIAYAEGTSRVGDQDGYNVLVGGRTFTGYSDHPNVSVYLPRYNIHSTAAGRYQILYRFWTHYKKQLGLPDFGPVSQDRYAIQQIRERRAYDDVIAGRISEAIDKCKNIWASLPGAGYGQRELPLRDLLSYYQKQGGKLA